MIWKISKNISCTEFNLWKNSSLREYGGRNSKFEYYFTNNNSNNNNLHFTFEPPAKYIDLKKREHVILQKN